MKAIVNKDACIGCGMCTSTCPNVFGYNDEGGFAEVKVEVVSDDDKEAVKDAQDGCPTGAISTEE